MTGKRTLIHLTGSPFVGGPERQMLGLSRRLPPDYRVHFLLFKDKGHSQALHSEATRLGFDCLTLEHDAPHYRKTIAEIAGVVTTLGGDVVCCHGYKADILGGRAARLIGRKTIAVSHGWTAMTWKVRINEMLDRWALRLMDRVVCVSSSQAEKVRRVGVNPRKIVVIRNAVDAPDVPPSVTEIAELRRKFAEPKRWLIAAAGRLSPEKGYEQYVAAAALLRQSHPDAGIILFGDGPLRPTIEGMIKRLGLTGHFILGGFRTDLASIWPGMDVAVLPSYTEGLPLMALEALAAGVPIVATAVGGTPEAVRDGVDGFLVAPRDPAAIADRVRQLLEDDARRKAMGSAGQRRVLSEFTFHAQAQAFCHVVDEILLANPLIEAGV